MLGPQLTDKRIEQAGLPIGLTKGNASHCEGRTNLSPSIITATHYKHQQQQQLNDRLYASPCVRLSIHSHFHCNEEKMLDTPCVCMRIWPYVCICIHL